jgi:hypothetical protein
VTPRFSKSLRAGRPRHRRAGSRPGTEAHTASWHRVLLLGAAGEQEENGLGASPWRTGEEPAQNVP